jgi:alkaline phosphatase D
MHAACPWLHTWDDHEVQNDYAGIALGNSGRASPPDTLEGFPARRAAAYQAFYEHMPLRASVLTRAVAGLAAGAEMRIYSQQRIGRLATLYLLDDRQYRDRHACTPDGRFGSADVNRAACASWDDPKRSLLGAAQEQWLEAALAAGGGTHWTVIGQQTLFGQRARRGAGQFLWNDGWDGYSAARKRLTDALQRHRVANPVLLGGDVHENWVGHVKADYARPDSATVGVEFCGTSITSRSGRKGTIPAALLAENPHFVFADSQRRGYGVCEFTPTHLMTSLRVVDDVRRKDAGIETLARFVVEAGRRQVEQA